MDHVVYLDHKARELENLKSGNKDMILRGAMGRKLPYEKVNPRDVLYFIENKGDGMVKAKAIVDEVANSDKLSPEDSFALLQRHGERLLLDDGMIKRFGGKRYLVLISLRNFEELEAFKIDRSAYKNMDDWLPVNNIETIKLK